MVLLGLLLVILALAAGVALVVGTQPLTSKVEFEVGVLNFVFTPLQLLIAGAVVMLLLALGLGLIRGSLRRRRRARLEARDAQRRAELEENVRADERARAEELHREELAERQRAHEAELADRDRAREEDFATRREELERRIRLDERGKVERELAGRGATAGTGTQAGSAGGATIGTAGGATAGDVADVEPGTDRTQRFDRTTDLPESSSPREGLDDTQAGDRPTAQRRPVVEPAEPGEPTVADRIMGRDRDHRD